MGCCWLSWCRGGVITRQQPSACNCNAVDSFLLDICSSASAHHHGQEEDQPVFWSTITIWPFFGCVKEYLNSIMQKSLLWLSQVPCLKISCLQQKSGHLSTARGGPWWVTPCLGASSPVSSKDPFEKERARVEWLSECSC